MDVKSLIPVYSNDLVRYITSRSYFYLYRQKVDDKYVVYYKDSPLLREIIDLYNSLPREQRSTYVGKASRKAE